jgi:hypothetical protein
VSNSASCVVSVSLTKQSTLVSASVTMQVLGVTFCPCLQHELDRIVVSNRIPRAAASSPTSSQRRKLAHGGGVEQISSPSLVFRFSLKFSVYLRQLNTN